MIRIHIKNFRGCRSAEIDCDPVALVAGRNGAGKTSLAQAAAAALTGEPLLGGMASKGTAANLVLDGAKNGSVEIEDPAGRVRVQWPDAEATARGTAPQASAYAAGRASLVDLSGRARGAVLTEYLHADPDRDDLAAAMVEHGLGEAAIVDAVWQLVADHGWDDAYTMRRDKGAELKGRWRQITSQVWGSRVGASWQPQGWSHDLEDADADALAAAIDRARAAYDAAIGRAAVSGAERERLAGEAGELDARVDALRDAEQAAERAVIALDDAQRVRAALPATPGGSPMPCPHCGGFVELIKISLVETRLVEAQVIASDELKARRRAVAEADGAIGRLTGEVASADRAVERARAEMQQASEAKHKLAVLPAPAAETDTTAAKGDLERAIVRESAWRQKTEADDLHGKIASNDVLLQILAGDGLRAAKLGRVIDAWNRSLDELTNAAGWPAVAVAPDMAVAAAGRAYALLSSSEQFRVRIILQVAMAQLDGSSMVVIDAADMLDAPARGGLMALLDRAGLPALVCMTASKIDQVPDLAAVGLGASYWIEGSVAARIGGKTREAA